MAGTSIVLKGSQGPEGAQGERGPAGSSGPNGKSAYQTWLDLGNSGTEQEFLDSLGSGSGTSLAEHEADTTNVHGIADTADLVVTSDSRLTGPRTPTSHASTHKGDGSDPIASANTSVAGLMSSSDKTKLDSVQNGATVNATDAQLRDRSTHTGTQSYLTITGLGTAALSSTSDFDATGTASSAVATHNADTTNVHGIVDTSDLVLTGDTRLTNSRTPTSHASTHKGGGADAIDDATTSVSGLMSPTDKTKLNGVQSGATFNATDSQLRDRSTHTGTQPYTTITGLGSAATANTGDFDAAGVAASAVSSHVAASDPHAQYQRELEKGQPNGYPSLDPSGIIPSAQLPALSFNNTFIVGSQSAMLALSAVKGDIAIRTDQNKTYILSSNSPSTLSDWVEILTGGGPTIVSVDGRTGVVSLADLYEAAGSVATHSADTTNVHGITDTSTIILEGDTRLSNSRTPTSHAANHLSNGSDPISSATTSVGGLLSASDKTKLDGVASGATANSSDAILKDRANHTGTQAASTISNFDTQVRASRLDQMAAPTAAVSMSNQKITNLSAPTLSADATTKNYVDTKAAEVTPDATTSLKGLVQLAGDLAGTAASPTVPALATKVNTSLTITSGTGLSGGGNLTANRTLSVVDNTTTQKLEISSSGTLIGTRKGLNLIAGANTGITVQDNSASDRVDVTITSTATGETNTGSNVGAAGVGVFKQKTGANLEFRNINAGSSKVSITNDSANNEIDVDVIPANFTGIPQSGVTNLTADINMDKAATTSNSSVTGSIAINPSTAALWDLTLTGNTSITFTGWPAGKVCSVTLIIRQDSTGNRALTWPTILWDNNTVPTSTLTANKVDVYTFMSANGGTTILGWMVGANMGSSDSYGPSVLTLSPYYYMRLSELSGTTAADSSTNSRNGTYIGSPTFGTASLVPSSSANSSLTLNGTDAAITQDSNPVAASRTTGTWSVSFVMKAADPGTEKRIYAEASSTSTSPVIAIGSADVAPTNRIRFFVRNDANTTVSTHYTTTAYFDNTTSHIVFTYNNGACKLYKNGSLDDSWTITPSGTFTVDKATWGALRRATGSNFYSGGLDEVAVWTTELTGSQVTQLYNSYLS